MLSACSRFSQRHSSRATSKGTRHTTVICMASPSSLVSDVSSYASKVKELLEKPGPHFVVFSADRDVAGVPWCPDCVRTVPAIEKMTSQRNGTLLEVQVGPRGAWKTPEHPFRSAPLKLTGIPTLVALSPDGSEVSRLGPELEACANEEQAEELLKTFAG